MLVGFDRYLMTMDEICQGILRPPVEGLAFFRGIHAGHSNPVGFMLAIQNIEGIAVDNMDDLALHDNLLAPGRYRHQKHDQQDAHDGETTLSDIHIDGVHP